MRTIAQLEQTVSTTRRTFIGTASAFATGVVAAACGPLAGESPGAGGSAAAPVTVQFGTRGTADTEPLYQAVADAFNERQKKVTVELWINEPDYYTKLPAAFIAGTGPDLAFTTSRNLLPWHDKGWLADLTAGLSRRRVRTTNWFDLATKEWQVGGKQLGVPQGWGTGVLGINKTLFQSAGITLKPDFDKTWTHDEFVRLLKEVAKVNPDGALAVWGINDWQPWTYFWDFGTDFLNKEKTRAVVNTPQGVAGMEWLYDLAWSHRVMARPSPHDRPLGDTNMWTSGNSALFHNGGPHVLTSWPRQLSFDFDIALYPIGPAGRHHRFYSDGYFIWKESKQQDAALDFIAYLGTDGQETMEKNGGRLVPAYRPVAEGTFLKGESPFTKRKWLDALKDARSQPLVVPFDEMNNIVNTYKGKVLSGTEGPREAVAAIEREVNTLLAQYPSPGGP